MGNAVTETKVYTTGRRQKHRYRHRPIQAC